VTEYKAKEFICQHLPVMLVLSLSGAIAQMGERLHGMQEVVGSNPIGSISMFFHHQKVYVVSKMNLQYLDNNRETTSNLKSQEYLFELMEKRALLAICLLNG
jgi:hypothetical protein